MHGEKDMVEVRERGGSEDRPVPPTERERSSHSQSGFFSGESGMGRPRPVDRARGKGKGPQGKDPAAAAKRAGGTAEKLLSQQQQQECLRGTHRATRSEEGEGAAITIKLSRERE